MSRGSSPLLPVLAALLAVVVVAVAAKLQAQHSAVTRVRAIKSSYRWTIGNYSLHRQRQGASLKSPVITTHDEALKLNWSLVAYPQGLPAESSNDSLAVYLAYNGGDLAEVQVRYSIRLLDKDDDDFKKVDNQQVVKRGEAIGTRRLAGADEIGNPKNRLLVGDELRIFVEFVAFIGDSSFSYECRRNASKAPVRVPHLERYLGNFEYSDVTLSVDDKFEFRAHRLLLAARSQVFDEIFKNYGTGKTALKFTMEDFRPETVAQALRYIYTGEIGKMSVDQAAELLTMTYKYNIDGLKDLVLEELCLKLEMDPEERKKALADIEYKATVVARKLPPDAQKACSIVPIDLSKIFVIEGTKP